MTRLAILSILALMPTCAAAQSLGQEPLEFNENLREQAEISGALFAGLQRSGSRPRIDGTSVHVEVPAHWAGGLACLRVTTANGLYNGVATYEVPADVSLLALEFPTHHADYLAGRPDGGVAALISLGDCADIPGESAVIRWDAADETAATLYLNAFRADRVYVYVGADPVPVECVPLDDPGRTAYDTRCDLAAIAADAPTDLEVLSVTNGQPSDPVRLTLAPMAAAR